MIDMNNPKDTATALFVMYAAFPNTEWSETTQAIYVKYLGDIPVDELKTIIGQAIATCKFPPTVAEIRDTWHGLRNIARLTYVEAWDSVQKEIRRIGSYGKPHFEDATTAQVVASMGWRDLCMSEEPQISRAQFRDMYNALLARGDTEQKLLPQARAYAEQRGGLLPLRNLLDVNGR